jgi:opacity protein-like surface antigen
MKKIYILIFSLFLMVFISDLANAQFKDRTQTPSWGYWSIAPFGGFNLPTGTFADNYKASGVAGIDVDYRVNRETAIFTSIVYNFLRTKDPAGPKSSYFSYVIGPRYHFTHPQLKSSLFVEGGVGGYTFNSDAYTINDPVSGTRTVDKVSDTRAGVNVGMGADLNLSSQFDIFVRSKYHLIFRTGGTSSFIGTDAGFRFKIY